ncbi:MAG: menaquinone biosynthesis protein, partial [Pyrinomonadaceae bacterium]|nr:menaquinone biosynthesis protein [Pyrinomonadaceae bacterium]
RPRIAASSYLNSVPLIWSFMRGAQQSCVELITDAAPARCADLLAHAAVDAALVPVIEYQRIPEILIVPEVCVGARHIVRSVRIATRGAELKDARTVALDTSSRTSAALTQIIFREFLGRVPQFTPCEPDLNRMLDAHDAALIIGDPGMTFEGEGLRIFDVASLWREFTGLSFVFAMWMAREGVQDKIRKVDFAGARDEGLAQVEVIAAQYEDLLNLPRRELCAYLLENICYELDDEMRTGLELFYKLAYKHNLIPSRRPLRMLGTL